MPDPRERYIEGETPTPTPAPKPKDPEGGVGSFVWEKMIKRSPGYAYEVLDALSPIKTRDIDWAKDPILGIIPLQIPPLAKGIFYLGREALTGDPGTNKRRRRRLEISLEFLKDRREQKLTPEAKAALNAELDQLFKIDFPGWDKEELTPRALLDMAGRQYPTWQALYHDLRDTIPGIGELEAIALLEPDQIPEATDRWVQRFKTEPLDLTVIALGVTKTKLLAKARNLRKRAAERTARVSEAQPLITQAEKYEKAAKYIGRANPEEAPIEAIGFAARSTARAIAPGQPAYNPEIEGQFGVDPETGRPQTTSIKPEDFGESIGIDKGTLPIAVLSDYDFAAMVEGWARFYDNQSAVKISNTEIREDTVAGAARRFLVSKQMILDQRRRHAEQVAEDVGAPSTTASDPNAAGKRGIEVYQNWEAQQDRNANDIAKQVAEGTTNPHDAGKVAHGHYEEWQLGKKSEFDKEFGEIGEALDQPLRSLTETPPSRQDIPSSEQIPEAPAPEAPAPEAPGQLLQMTRAKLEELRAADSKLLSDPDLDKVSQILDSIIEDAAQDGLTLHDFDKMRTNFRKRLTGAVQNGEMTPIGSAEISRLFYQTLTEDFYNLIEDEVGINPEAFPPDMLDKIRNAKRDYRTTKVEIEESPAIQFLRKTQDNPAMLIDELLKEKGIYNPDQLAILKSTLGNEGWAELQAALLDRFIGEATNPSTGNIYRDRLAKQIDKLNATHPEKASLLFDRIDMDGSRVGSAKISNVEKLRQIANRTDLENSATAQFLQKTENAPAALIDELLKEKGIFNPDEIKNLKSILGEQGFSELQPGLLGRLYEMAAKRETTPEQLTSTGLRTVLKQITGRDKNRLVDLFGKETAEFLEQSALFSERFARAGTWHKGSPTAKLQALLGKGAAGGGIVMLADQIGLQLIHGGYNFTNLGTPQYIGIALLTASWGSVAGFNKFVMSEAGRKWLLEGFEVGMPGTNIKINATTLLETANWMTENKFELGFITHKVGEAARKTDKQNEPEPAPRRETLPPARNPFSGYGKPPVE